MTYFDFDDRASNTLLGEPAPVRWDGYMIYFDAHTGVVNKERGDGNRMRALYSPAACASYIVKANSSILH